MRENLILLMAALGVMLFTLAGAGWLAERWVDWKERQSSHPRLRRAVKARRIPPTVETTARKKTVVYGDREVKAR